MAMKHYGPSRETLFTLTAEPSSPSVGRILEVAAPRPDKTFRLL